MELTSIFTQMSWISGGLLCLGLLFVIVEVFIPGFGFFGVTGVISLLAGIVVRIVEGLTIEQSLALILIVLGVIVVGSMLLVFSAKYGILGKTGLIENKSSLSKNYDKPELLSRFLIYYLLSLFYLLLRIFQAQEFDL